MHLHLNPWKGSWEAVCFLHIQLSLHVPSVNNELSLCSTPFQQPSYFHFLFVLLSPRFPRYHSISHLSLFFSLHCIWCASYNVKANETWSFCSLNTSTVQADRDDLNVKTKRWRQRGVCVCLCVYNAVTEQGLLCWFMSISLGLFAQAIHKILKNSKDAQAKQTNGLKTSNGNEI